MSLSTTNHPEITDAKKDKSTNIINTSSNPQQKYNQEMERFFNKEEMERFFNKELEEKMPFCAKFIVYTPSSGMLTFDSLPRESGANSDIFKVSSARVMDHLKGKFAQKIMNQLSITAKCTEPGVAYPLWLLAQPITFPIKIPIDPKEMHELNKFLLMKKVKEEKSTIASVLCLLKQPNKKDAKDVKDFPRHIDKLNTLSDADNAKLLCEIVGASATDLPYEQAKSIAHHTLQLKRKASDKLLEYKNNFEIYKALLSSGFFKTESERIHALHKSNTESPEVFNDYATNLMLRSKYSK